MNKKTLLIIFAMLCLKVNASEQINKIIEPGTEVSFIGDLKDDLYTVKMAMLKGEKSNVLIYIHFYADMITEDFHNRIKDSLSEISNLFVAHNNSRLSKEAKFLYATNYETLDPLIKEQVKAIKKTLAPKKKSFFFF